MQENEILSWEVTEPLHDVCSEIETAIRLVTSQTFHEFTSHDVPTEGIAEAFEIRLIEHIQKFIDRKREGVCVHCGKQQCSVYCIEDWRHQL